MGSARAKDDDDDDDIVAEINITPLTDIFLVLLIIFMVTSTALVENEAALRNGVKVNLPQANAGTNVSQKRADPILTITQGGQLYLGTAKIEDIGKLGDEIKKGLEAAQSETLLIRGDQNVLLGKAVDIMSVARKAGAKSIGILTKSK
jgi:biopolymer transport protein ExbD